MTIPLKVNETIVFGVGERSAPALLQGWGNPEDGQVWTEGSNAVLRFSLFSVPMGSVLDFRASPHLSDTVRAQRVGIYGNGLYAGSRLLDENGEFTIAMPPFICMSVIVSGTLDLAFDIPGCRPGSGADKRMLGFALHSLTLRSN